MHATVFFGSAVKILEDVKAHVCFSIPAHSNPFSTTDTLDTTSATAAAAHQSSDQWKEEAIEPSSGSSSYDSHDRTPLLQRSSRDKNYSSTTHTIPSKRGINDNVNATNHQHITLEHGSHQPVFNTTSSQAIPIPQNEQQPLTASTMMEMMNSVGISSDRNSLGRSLDTPIGSLSLLQSITDPSNFAGSQFLSVYDMTDEEMQRHVVSRARVLSQRGGYTQNVLRSINNYPSLDSSSPSHSKKTLISEGDIESGTGTGRSNRPISIGIGTRVSLLSREIEHSKSSIGEEVQLVIFTVIFIVMLSKSNQSICLSACMSSDLDYEADGGTLLLSGEAGMTTDAADGSNGSVSTSKDMQSAVSLTKRVSFHEEKALLLQSSHSSIDRINKSRSNSGVSSMDSMDSINSRVGKSPSDSVLAAVWDQQQQSRMNRNNSRGQMLSILSADLTVTPSHATAVNEQSAVMRKESSSYEGELHHTTRRTSSSEGGGGDSSPLLQHTETMGVDSDPSTSNQPVVEGVHSNLTHKPNTVMTEYLVSRLDELHRHFIHPSIHRPSIYSNFIHLSTICRC